MQLYKIPYNKKLKQSSRLFDGIDTPNIVMIFCDNKNNYWMDYDDYNKWLSLNNLEELYDIFKFVETTTVNKTSNSTEYKYDGKIRVHIKDWDNYIKRKYNKV